MSFCAPKWWGCPNTPPCPHGSILHDVEDYDDPSPRCCVDGCGCGARMTAAAGIGRIVRVTDR